MSKDISVEQLSALKKLSTRFSDLPDIRQKGKVRHPLGEVLTIGFCSMMCGFDHFTEMELFAKSQEGWLGQFLELRDGPPSHDTFRNVFSGINPDAFSEVLAQWSGRPVVSDGHLAIDGKAICGTGVHLVRAWADSLGISIGQVACAEKSNEIEAIPRLLDKLVLDGAAVSIDAIGCQTEIASKIDDGGGFYLLALKKNQAETHSAVSKHFESGGGGACARTEEFSRGRHEVRICTVEEDLSFLGKSWKWQGLTCVVRVRTEICRHGGRGTDMSESTCEDRYYLCSLPEGRRQAQDLLALARAHWSVENRCHWMLDVVFGEDACPVRDKVAARNLSTMRGIVLAILREDSGKGSLRSKRQRAALDPAFRSKIISMLHA